MSEDIIIAVLPFSIVIGFMVISLLKSLHHEEKFMRSTEPRKSKKLKTAVKP
ncbi:hypothetical protein ACFSFW_12945 [Fredinandcohnia salidurans]|uniref:Uncharacterized protein n=1 Tax=Fredinandcohnia salidurans TaxID=2595041 RepID=A0ABW4MP34_9BACI|nr:hypothetical protein [Fredinandcohnia onubensis]